MGGRYSPASLNKWAAARKGPWKGSMTRIWGGEGGCRSWAQARVNIQQCGELSPAAARHWTVPEKEIGGFKKEHSSVKNQAAVFEPLSRKSG